MTALLTVLSAINTCSVWASQSQTIINFVFLPLDLLPYTFLSSIRSGPESVWMMIVSETWNSAESSSEYSSPCLHVPPTSGMNCPGISYSPLKKSKIKIMSHCHIHPPRSANPFLFNLTASREGIIEFFLVISVHLVELVGWQLGLIVMILLSS